jgi:hypothetical protein
MTPENQARVIILQNSQVKVTWAGASVSNRAAFSTCRNRRRDKPATDFGILAAMFMLRQQFPAHSAHRSRPFKLEARSD